ncbi:MAG: TauD/TfdA family dioxygenase [Proteobacteria bacterium]|nr:TauD/TfdA family dioxygenase [Pseudomonadota bacterium]
MATIRPTGSACGAVVEDVDLTHDLSDDLTRQLTGALYDHRCLVIKNQTLTKDAYYRFAGEWGELIRHVLDYLRMPGFPEMMAIGNTETKDRDPGVRNGAVAWHTDGSYIEDPTTITMLHAVRAPRRGGETMVADMVAAYEALDPALRSEVDEMTALHYYGRAEVGPDENPVIPIKTEAQATTNDVCEKPLVLTHPVSGRRALYAVAQSPFQINGMTEIETQHFLARLKTHATSADFVYDHRYEVGDILIFDTLSTMHRAKGNIEAASTPEADNARLLWRLSAKGLPKVHRHLAA